MKDITAYLTNYTAPSAGFSLGRLKDDPGDGTGSGATVNTGNDWLYGMYAPILKYKGAVSGSDESETASDMLDSIELAVGVQNENVTDEWDNSTTYSQDDHVMYNGMQFVSLTNTNSGNNPFESDEWLPCLNRDEAFRCHREGKAIPGGFFPLHDKRDTTNYREFFEWGLYNYGGAGAAAKNFQGYGIHLDGQVLSGDADYIAIFDIGGADEYLMLDIVAPDVLGTRTMIDAKGRVARVVDGSGGDTEDVGVVQEDAMQGHIHSSFDTAFGPVVSSASQGSSVSGIAITLGAAVTQNEIETNVPKTDGTNGTPRTGSETVMKNFTEGLPTLFVLLEI